MRARLFLLMIPGLLSAQSLQDFEKKVTKFNLSNGLTMLVIERHEAPVVSFHTYVNVGSVDDFSGRTGLAHMFEHMAFKGTETIGTKNWPEEKKALDYVEPNEYDRIVESNGGVGMNANTAEDQTQYFYSFPSNRIELWFLLESSRFLNPVLREFYKERDVVREERRMSTESSPLGQLVEQLLATAFTAHPYKTSPIGWSSDIEQLRRTEAEQFYKRYYTPGNMTIAISGDVNPAEAKRLAEKYFARLPKAPPPPRVRTVEPPQEGQKRVAVASAAQPFLVVGYKRPNQYSPDDAPLDVLSDVLSDGRTGIIYKDMVRDKQIALGAESDANFPGGKYPSLFLFFVVSATGHSVEENEKAVDAIVDRIKKEKVDDASIQRVKTKLR